MATEGRQFVLSAERIIFLYQFQEREERRMSSQLNTLGRGMFNLGALLQYYIDMLLQLFGKHDQSFLNGPGRPLDYLF
ncbi:MAG TPA: hypothetical protein DCS05_02435 [Nitrospiraceae bacterium]|nr:hypothetical protein [Nitrospiraceae bacterium]